MIRDCFGTELKPGHLVQVMIGNPPQAFRGRISGLRDGGMVIMAGKDSPSGMSPDIVIITMDIVLIQEAPGQAHAAVMRLADPETETIVKKGH
jgi:hypothetical protein